MALLIPLGFYGVQHYLLPIFGLDSDAADDPVLQLSADDPGVSERRWVVHGGQRKPGRPGRAAAAAALMIDYILTAAVGISAGVTALVSAFQESVGPDAASAPAADVPDHPGR
jgi:hypothetical protein